MFPYRATLPVFQLVVSSLCCVVQECAVQAVGVLPAASNSITMYHWTEHCLEVSTCDWGLSKHKKQRTTLLLQLSISLTCIKSTMLLILSDTDQAVNPISNLPFGDGLCHPSMVILRVVLLFSLPYDILYYTHTHTYTYAYI